MCKCYVFLFTLPLQLLLSTSSYYFISLFATSNTQTKCNKYRKKSTSCQRADLNRLGEWKKGCFRTPYYLCTMLSCDYYPQNRKTRSKKKKKKKQKKSHQIIASLQSFVTYMKDFACEKRTMNEYPSQQNWLSLLLNLTHALTSIEYFVYASTVSHGTHNKIIIKKFYMNMLDIIYFTCLLERAFTVQKIFQAKCYTTPFTITINSNEKQTVLAYIYK